MSLNFTAAETCLKRETLATVSPQLPVIPSELISETLFRLPVRSLVRFRCVCRKWKSAISDTHFSRLHLYRSTMDPTLNHHRLLLFIHTISQPRILSCSVNSLFNNTFTPFENHSYTLRSCTYYLILGTCNGVVCFYDPRTMHLRLHNPSTMLTSRKVYPFQGYTLDMVLSYHGFGYDHAGDKFKALVVFHDPSPQDSDRTVTRVYAFGDSGWKTIQNLNFLGYPTNGSGVFVCETLNWVAPAKRAGPGGPSHVIHSFDLGKDTFGEVSLPDSGHDVDNPVYPVHAALKNCLSVCYDLKGTRYVVWLMKEYGVKESWTKFMTIPHIELLVSRFCPDVMQPLCMSENGQVLLNSLSSHVKTVVYDPKVGQLEYPLSQSGMVCYSQHVYLESLVSPCF